MKPPQITIHTSHPDPTTDPDHAWIEIGTEPHDEAASLAEALAHHRHAASVLARLAVTLAEDIADERTNHPGCFRIPGHPYLGGCQITGNNLTPTPDTIALGPLITVDIPPARLRHWKTLTKRKLDEILKADRHKPTAAEEHNWQPARDEPPLEQHYRAPTTTTEEATR